MLRLAALFLCVSFPAQAETALVAVAANFAQTAAKLADQFQAQTGHHIDITTGSTGKLYAQITQGAPFDVLLSADSETPARLFADGHGQPQPYAIGLLTLWAPLAATGLAPADLLQSPSIRHIAIANPDLAPYGQAAVAALQAMGLDATLKDKIVMGQNVGQAFAMVDTGAAEAGFIAKSALPTAAKGYVWDVPASLAPPIQQDAILLQHGAKNPAAIGFLAYLTSPSARQTISQNGYGLP
ncbi:molybdate ABC transporter substrate-binding protein [Pseudorhodobacter sp. W20_MBD10_FR17]|uniref:molybdate ABC transporter substrate-binding protein n=1 Tax=Pseudorhodobacter sp. W20_MBD10_FR17 TaxID=3240266 RepID=UPI003F99DBAB